MKNTVKHPIYFTYVYVACLSCQNVTLGRACFALVFISVPHSALRSQNQNLFSKYLSAEHIPIKMR